MTEAQTTTTELRPDGDTAADAAANEAAVAVEERARLLGWKDKTEFDRPPERWVDAKTFIERGETALPVLKENLHRVEAMVAPLQSENRDLKADVAGLRSSVEHLRDLAMTAEQRAYERAKRDFANDKQALEARIDQGAAEANVPVVKSAREALAALKEPTPPAEPRVEPVRTATPTGPAIDPSEKAAVEAFTAAEKWFKTPANANGNDEATEFASARYGALQRSAPGMTHSERLAEVRKSVGKRFPELFTPPASGDAPRVATPSGGGTGARSAASALSFNAIPEADRAAARKMIADVNKGRKDGKAFTEAEYAALYFKGQA